MKETFDQLKNDWKEAKKEQLSTDSRAMLRIILKNHASSQKTHLANICILFMTALGLTAFFYFLAPMQETLSRVGIVLMIGGLIVRILIELISHRKAAQIDYATHSSHSTREAQAFYEYRKKIHGPITFTIIALYTIGFYSLTPEFSTHFSTFWMWMIDGSYFVMGVVLFFVIRKGVVQEMRGLRQVRDLQDALNDI